MVSVSDFGNWAEDFFKSTFVCHFGTKFWSGFSGFELVSELFNLGDGYTWDIWPME